GSLTVLVDLGFYTLLNFLGVSSFDINKAISFIIGTLFAYVANRFWTFSHTNAPGKLHYFFLLYLSSLVVNVTANGILIRIFGEIEPWIFIAFIIATGMSAVMNFLGMKFIVFKKV